MQPCPFSYLRHLSRYSPHHKSKGASVAGEQACLPASDVSLKNGRWSTAGQQSGSGGGCTAAQVPSHALHALVWAGYLTVLVLASLSENQR